MACNNQLSPDPCYKQSAVFDHQIYCKQYVWIVNIDCMIIYSAIHVFIYNPISMVSSLHSFGRLVRINIIFKFCVVLHSLVSFAYYIISVNNFFFFYFFSRLCLYVVCRVAAAAAAAATKIMANRQPIYASHYVI